MVQGVSLPTAVPLAVDDVGGRRCGRSTMWTVENVPLLSTMSTVDGVPLLDCPLLSTVDGVDARN